MYNDPGDHQRPSVWRLEVVVDETAVDMKILYLVVPLLFRLGQENGRCCIITLAENEISSHEVPSMMIQ
jgi:hypothetical protein